MGAPEDPRFDRTVCNTVQVSSANDSKLKKLRKSMKHLFKFGESSRGLQRTKSAFVVETKDTRPSPGKTEPESDQLKVFRQRLASSVAAAKSGERFPEFKGRFGSDSLSLDLMPGRKREFESPVHRAVAAGNISELNKLLQAENCDVDEFDGKDTPLHLAAKAGDLRLVQLLLLKGAAVDKSDSDGWNALHHASLEGHTVIIRQLLESGAKLTEVTEDGMSPLHCAVHLKNCINSRETANSSLEVVNELIKW